jgi:uncharacterized RDD family membrane protein YckC
MNVAAAGCGSECPLVSAYPATLPRDPTAVGGRRVVAAIVDVGLAWIIWLVVFFALAKRAPAFVPVRDVCPSRPCTSLGHRYVTGGGSTVVWGAWGLYLFATCVVQRGLTGRTLGTTIMGIATVDAQGQPLGVGSALVRSIAGIIDYLPCCFPLVGLILVLQHHHRRVGDRAAGSYVVRQEDVGRPVVVSAGSAGPPPPAWGAAPTAPPWETVPTAPPMAPPAGAAPTDAAAEASASPPSGPPVVPPTAAAPAPTAPPDPTQPQWDEARGAYIQWDQTGQRWMVFDQATQTWRAL